METEDSEALPPTKRAKPPFADWQLERIRTGLADMRAGRVYPADEVFAETAAKHGWALRSNYPQ